MLKSKPKPSLAPDPEVEGMGKVVDAWIDDDELRDGPMSDCVEDAMRALQFDPPEGGSTSVTYPIVFRPESP